jgi:hypothetical protein
LTIVKVNGGACGFVARIRARKTDKRSLVVEIESECKSVRELGRAIAETGPLTMRDILARSEADNPVFREASVSLPHAACPVRVAIMKAAEVELGLAVPRDVSIEFEPDGNGALRDAGALDIPSEANHEEGRQPAK